MGHSTAGRRRTTQPALMGRPRSRAKQRKEVRPVSAEEAKPTLLRTTELQSKLYQAVRCADRPGERPMESRVRENRTHGSERGRWKHDLPHP